MAFTTAQVDHLQKNSDFIEARLLVAVFLASDTVRMIEGNVGATLGGFDWLPSFDWVKPATVQAGSPLDAVAATYQLSTAPADLVSDVFNRREEWYGKYIQQWLQLYVRGVPLGPMVSIHRGRMMDIVLTRSATDEYLEITSEGVLAARNFTPLGKYTDRDQQRRTPGDRGCEYTPSMPGKTVVGWLRG